MKPKRNFNTISIIKTEKDLFKPALGCGQKFKPLCRAQTTLHGLVKVEVLERWLEGKRTILGPSPESHTKSVEAKPSSLCKQTLTDRIKSGLTEPVYSNTKVKWESCFTLCSFAQTALADVMMAVRLSEDRYLLSAIKGYINVTSHFYVLSLTFVSAHKIKIL